jgi:hypothetical protein
MHNLSSSRKNKNKANFDTSDPNQWSRSESGPLQTGSTLCDVDAVRPLDGPVVTGKVLCAAGKSSDESGKSPQGTKTNTKISCSAPDRTAQLQSALLSNSDTNYFVDPLKEFLERIKRKTTLKGTLSLFHSKF